MNRRSLVLVRYVHNYNTIYVHNYIGLLRSYMPLILAEHDHEFHVPCKPFVDAHLNNCFVQFVSFTPRAVDRDC